MLGGMGLKARGQKGILVRYLVRLYQRGSIFKICQTGSLSTRKLTIGMCVAPGPIVITAAFTPPSDKVEDFNNWYGKEHYAMLAKCKGYLRSRRYRIHKTMSMKGKQAPMFLAIHEFEEGELDARGLGASVATEWGKKVMGGLVENQTDVWRMRGMGFGKLEREF